MTIRWRALWNIFSIMQALGNWLHISKKERKSYVPLFKTQVIVGLDNSSSEPFQFFWARSGMFKVFSPKRRRFRSKFQIVLNTSYLATIRLSKTNFAQVFYPTIHSTDLFTLLSELRLLSPWDVTYKRRRVWSSTPRRRFEEEKKESGKNDCIGLGGYVGWGHLKLWKKQWAATEKWLLPDKEDQGKINL